jgi:hypothetical protein
MPSWRDRVELGASNACAMAAANAAGSFGSQNTATPSASSRRTGRSLQITGTPHAIASITGRPKPSARDGNTTAAAPR